MHKKYRLITDFFPQAIHLLKMICPLQQHAGFSSKSDGTSTYSESAPDKLGSRRYIHSTDHHPATTATRGDHAAIAIPACTWHCQASAHSTNCFAAASDTDSAVTCT